MQAQLQFGQQQALQCIAEAGQPAALVHPMVGVVGLLCGIQPFQVLLLQLFEVLFQQAWQAGQQRTLARREYAVQRRIQRRQLPQCRAGAGQRL